MNFQFRGNRRLTCSFRKWYGVPYTRFSLLVASGRGSNAGLWHWYPLLDGFYRRTWWSRSYNSFHFSLVAFRLLSHTVLRHAVWSPQGVVIFIWAVDNHLLDVAGNGKITCFSTRLLVLALVIPVWIHTCLLFSCQKDGRTSFCTSRAAGLPVVNSLHSCLKTPLFYLQFWKIPLLGIEFQLGTSATLLCGSREKSADALVFIPLRRMVLLWPPWGHLCRSFWAVWTWHAL